MQIQHTDTSGGQTICLDFMFSPSPRNIRILCRVTHSSIHCHQYILTRSPTLTSTEENRERSGSEGTLNLHRRRALCPTATTLRLPEVSTCRIGITSKLSTRKNDTDSIYGHLQLLNWYSFSIQHHFSIEKGPELVPIPHVDISAA